MIYFDLLLNHHEASSVYDFRKANYNAINDALYSHPFNNNIIDANSADKASFTDSVDHLRKP